MAGLLRPAACNPICPTMLRIHQFLTFASDAELLALWGVGFILVAVLALLAEKRRHHREPLERMRKVGWMPWTTIFMACMIIGGGMLAMALPKVIAG